MVVLFKLKWMFGLFWEISVIHTRLGINGLILDLRNAGVTCIRTVCFIECFNAMMILQFLHKLECSWEAKFSWQCFRMLSILYYIQMTVFNFDMVFCIILWYYSLFQNIYAAQLKDFKNKNPHISERSAIEIDRRKNIQDNEINRKINRDENS